MLRNFGKQLVVRMWQFVFAAPLGVTTARYKMSWNPGSTYETVAMPI
jgi:hypothetical protein